MKHLCLLTLLLAANIVLAKEVKIGFVDYDKAIKDEKEAQEFFKNLGVQEGEVAAWEEKAKREFEKKMATYKDAQSKWKEDKRKVEEGKLSAEINDLQQESARRRQELSTNQQARLDELKTKNTHIIEAIARKEGYSMVFNAAALVWVSDDMLKNADLTAKLAKQYNEKYPVKAAPAKPDTKAKPGVKGPEKAPGKPEVPAMPDTKAKPGVKGPEKVPGKPEGKPAPAA